MNLMKLGDFLLQVQRRAGSSFVGVGVIVTSDSSVLPIASLRPDLPFRNVGPPVEVLAALSVATSELHDGFHVILPDYSIERVAQYFGPPVGDPPSLPHGRALGARYMTALLGSRLPSVIATGIATVDQGVTIFVRGKEVKG